MDAMRRFHRLIFDSARKDLASISAYELGDFSPVTFWTGTRFNEQFPTNMRLEVERSDYLDPDLLGNPLSWLICSTRFVVLMRKTAERDIQVFAVPLVDNQTREMVTGYHIVNPTRLVECLNVERSIVSRKADGTLAAVYEIAVRESKVPNDANIFRIAEQPNIVLFSDDAVLPLLGKDLLGLAFVQCAST